MFQRTKWMLSRRNTKSGFYVAQHPWLTSQGVVKVGFSTDISKRLRMANYTTCFSDEWSYVVTFPCSPKHARLLEYCVLQAFKAQRVDGRELLSVNPQCIVTVAQRVSKLLSIETAAQYVHKANTTKTSDGGQIKLLKAPSAVRATFELHQAAIEDIARVTLLPCPISVPPDCAATINEDLEAEINGISNANKDSALEDDDNVRDALLAAEPIEPVVKVELRDYQLEAATRSWNELQTSSKAIIQMACRSGKTPVAHQLILREFQRDGRARVVFVVPGLALLRQTAVKLVAYGLPEGVRLLLVGSDPLVVQLGDGWTTQMTTEASNIEAALSDAPVVVITTYASSQLVYHASIATNSVISFTIFDEAHRVCGSASLSPFNYLLLRPLSQQSLFLTATPTYDTALRMDDKSMFGGIAYRYYLREGITRGFINPFALEIVLGDMDDMSSMVQKAMTSVDKMLVFCRNIQHAEELWRQVSSAISSDHKCLVAHSRQGPRTVHETLSLFKRERRAVLFNVRLFQEGVEVPDLNSVFFAAPRYSPRDIIQSICRPLNVLAGKPPSTIFLPAHYDERQPADAGPNLESFATLVPYTDALMDEDPTLFEYLIDPSKCNYKIRVVGARTLRTSDQELQRMILPSIRRGVRYSKRQSDRLHRAERLPWKLAFAELRRIVTECHRYPKINDAWVVGDARVPLHAFYRYCREGYALHCNGQPTQLQVHQIRDLESLPMWTTYGVEGPYPWKECMLTLEKHLSRHRTLPPLDIHRGGFVGLDATPFERLAGALCGVNQQEREDYMAVSASKQADLDKVLKPFGIEWRKPRTSKGKLRKGAKSPITECYDEFKRRFATCDNEFRSYIDEHFPGYPNKHKFMENIDVQQKGTAPPRLKVRSEAQLRRMKAKGLTELQEHVVVCRQCRVEVHSSAWKSHIASESHQAKVKSLL